jgi:protease-4
MTDEQKKIFQSVVGEAYEQFVGVVAKGRGMQVNDVKRIADGRVYTAKQALDNKLVDKICTYEEALDIIEEELGDKELFENEHNPPLKSGFGSLFSSLSKIAPKNEAEVILDTLKAYNKTGYYCPELAE